MEGLTCKALSLNWLRSKSEFAEYLRFKKYNLIYARSILSYLNRFVGELREPMDIVRACSPLTSGQQHNLNRGLRALFNFYELKGFDANFLNAMRKAIPKDNIGIDCKVPSFEEIFGSLKKLSEAPLKYRALYVLLLDSGLRLVEAARLINERKGEDFAKVQAFYRCSLGYFRGSKLAYAGYFSEDTLRLIQRVSEPINERNASHYYMKYRYVAPKYLRKFAFDKMIQLGIPESVADFIEGRCPKKIGAKHYMALLRQADRFYGRYAKWLQKMKVN